MFFSILVAELQSLQFVAELQTVLAFNVQVVSAGFDLLLM